MTLALVFWVLYLVFLIISITRNYDNRVFIIDNLVYWILIGLLGFGVFGSPIK